MAKTKNKRNSGLADKVHNKRKSEVHKKKLNPFEVHINREKLKVLGKKSKDDRGLPGVSRGKAMQKRKETLGTELKLISKTNSFIDRRIGEKNSKMSVEDKVIARFAAERAKIHKNDIYNLADDEVLTHRGQTLEEIEKFDDPRSSDDEDDDGRKLGGLDDEFVSEGHFGGGVLSKTAKDGAKSHKDLIEQLIVESKKRKAEKQKEKEQTLNLTEQLDKDWKDLQPVVFKRSRLEEENEKPSIIDKLLSRVEKRNEDYDKTMRELTFEKRGTPSDGLKNQEELEREERAKIERLEKERVARMHDPEIVKQVSQSTNKHRSADDLDDDFELDEAVNYMLSYDKDGNPLMPEHVFKQNSGFPSSQKTEGDISDANGDDTLDGSGDEEQDTGEEDDGDDEEEVENEESEESDDEDVSVEEQKESSAGNKIIELNHIKRNGKVDSYDDYKDLKETHDDDDDDEEIIDHEVQEKIESFFNTKDFESDNLKELLKDKTPKQQAATLQRLIQKHNPSLSEDNKDKLNSLYAHLLKYLNDLFTNLQTEEEVTNSFEIFDKIAPVFYDLAHKSVVVAKKYLMELITEKRTQFRKNPKRMPDLDTLVFFKLASLLYPTSDYRHPVVTPCYVFITEILRESNFDSPYSISRGLFLAALLLEYTVLSKKYVPSLVNFLRGILYLCLNMGSKSTQLVPPFRLRKNERYLNLEDDCSNLPVGEKMAAKDLILECADNDFKIRSLDTCVKILKEYFERFNDVAAQGCIFKPHIDLISRLELNSYPKLVKERISEMLKYMKEILLKPLAPLAQEKKKPKVLRLYEPDVQEVFTGNKMSKLSRDKVESSKLKSKYKRAMKGALREIRRDKSYIASVKLRQKIQSDNVRKEKVKQIYKEASLQQGELNKLKRMK